MDNKLNTPGEQNTYFDPHSTADYASEACDNALSSEKLNTKIKAVGRVFSRAHLALIAYLVITFVTSLILSVISPLVFPIEWFDDDVFNAVFSIVLSSICQYLIAFPIAILMFKFIPKIEKNDGMIKYNIGQILALFAICQGLTYVGNIIGNIIGSVGETIFGLSSENPLDALLESLPLGMIFVVVVVIGPIVEEILFRKLLFDRLAQAGDLYAILFTAFAFGAFHTNIYQFFYAVLAGAVLGYVYSRTRKLRYSIILHSMMNFTGSILSMIMLRITTDLDEMLIALENGEDVNQLLMIGYSMLTMLYSIMILGIAIAGIVFLILAFTKKKLVFRNTGNTPTVSNKILTKSVINVGFILFYVVAFAMTIINFFTS